MSIIVGFRLYPFCPLKTLSKEAFRAVLERNCSGITVKNYETICNALKQLNIKDGRLKTLSQAERDAITSAIRSMPTADKCYFKPLADWTSSDCLDWFRVIGFDASGLRRSDLEKINGRILLYGPDGKIMREDEWGRLKRAYSQYLLQFCIVNDDSEYAKCPISVNSFFQLPEWKSTHSLASVINDLAFGIDYIPVSCTEEDFTAVIREIVDEKPYPPPGHPQVEIKGKVFRYFAPYTALLQCSCSGKTRFLQTPIKADKQVRTMVVYSTLKSKVAGQPNSKFIKDVVAMIKDQPLEQSSRTLGQIYCAIASRLVGPDLFLKHEYVSKGSVDADEIWPSTDKPSVRPIDLPKLKAWHDGKNKKLSVVLAIDEAHLLLDDVIDNRVDLGISQQSINEQKEKRGLELAASVQDEANRGQNNKISAFAILLRALIVQKWKGICIPTVLCSANSQIANFMPHVSHDPSRREDLLGLDRSIELYLHRPIILQETFDLYGRTLTIQANPYEYLQSFEYLKNLFLFGRAYWGSLLKAGDEKVFGTNSNEDDGMKCDGDIMNIENDASEVDSDEVTLDRMNVIVRMAEEKLSIGTNHLPSIKESVASLDALALLGHTLGIRSISNGDLARKIVESRMGFLGFVDNIHGFVTAGFHPDPVLAIVSSNALLLKNGEGAVAALSEYCRLSELGTINIWESGELVCRAALFLARMTARPVVKIKSGIPHEALLYALPRKWGEILANLAPYPPQSVPDEFANSLVNFTNFVKVPALTDNVNFTALLEKALVRSSGLIMPDGEQGVDFVIPLVTPKGRITCALIQVKNYAALKQVTQSICLCRMQTFAKLQSLDSPFYLLTLLNHSSGEAATLSKFASRTLTSLADTYKGDRSFAGLLLKGSSFSLPGIAEKSALDNTLCNLSDAYRSGRNRLTPKFSCFQVPNESTFLKSRHQSSRSKNN